MKLRQFSAIEMAGAAKALTAPAPSPELIAQVRKITHAGGVLDQLAANHRAARH